MDAYAPHRNAGELFGRIQAGLGFGMLSMYYEEGNFVFVWQIVAAGQPYHVKWSMDTTDILIQRDHADMAERIVSKWKHELRSMPKV